MATKVTHGVVQRSPFQLLKGIFPSMKVTRQRISRPQSIMIIKNIPEVVERIPADGINDTKEKVSIRVPRPTT